jgi:pimeloyl-ACP methyl ester carboxylesterase
LAYQRGMSFDQTTVDFLDVAERPIAFRRRRGSSPTLIFLPGYASDMEGAKALALDAFAAERGVAMLRLDYSGTGSSGGRFEDGTLELWLEEVLAAIDRLTDGPLIVIGSSMGGWIALHIALRRPERVQAVVGIAAAPDFTEWGFTAGQKAELQANGRIEEPNPYAPEPQLFTAAFWRSGQDLRLLDDPLDIGCPVRLVHGEEDEDVPLSVAQRTMRMVRSADVQLLTIKGGGHRLSEPHEIRAILRTVATLLEPA